MLVNSNCTQKYASSPIHELVFASSKGDPDAQFVLATKYDTGDSLLQNTRKAFSLYKKAARSGHAAAQYRLACLYLETERHNAIFETRPHISTLAYRFLHVVSPVIIRDDFEAFKWMRLSALQANPQAEFGFADMLYSGYGCTKDKEEAKKWYQRSGDHGCLDAYFSLGKIINGITTYRGNNKLILADPSHAEAFNWWFKAAEKGHVLAQCEIADMYAYGRGVSQDYHQSLKWYSRAAEQKSREALLHLAYWAKNGTVTGQANYDEAAKFYRLALSLGSDLAGEALLDLYKNNHILPNSDAELASWTIADKILAERAKEIHFYCGTRHE